VWALRVSDQQPGHEGMQGAFDKRERKRLMCKLELYLPVQREIEVENIF
jgi:uncharacterized protein (DUF2164 family)